jgi:hypothetical protein
MKKIGVILGLVLLVIVGSIGISQEIPDPISIFTDFPSFNNAAGSLTEIDFENLPPDASSCPIEPEQSVIPNPLVLDGVTFTDPYCLVAGFCSSPTCQPDPDNPWGGNIVLALNPSGTIDFPSETGGAMLEIQGIGDNPFEVQVTDFAGNTITASGQGVSFDVAFLGFISPNGIQRIEILNVGGTGGPLALSAVYFSQDSDQDGIPDKEDACLTTPGRVEYQGCPVGDENLVELHVIDKPKIFCGGKGSCKVPIEGAEVRVFDRNDPDFQANFTKNPKGTQYPDIFEADIGRVGSCFTDTTGKCIAGEEAVGDYLVIVRFIDAETSKIIYTGKPKSPEDFEDTDGDGIGDLVSKDFQIIKVINKDGSIDFKAGSKTVITGSFLEVIHPQK